MDKRVTMKVTPPDAGFPMSPPASPTDAQEESYAILTERFANYNFDRSLF